MKKYYLLSLLIFLVFTEDSYAQKFLPPFYGFSSKKPGYILLNSGEQVDLNVRNVKRKKGGIVSIKGRKPGGKETFTYYAKDMKELALAPTTLDKIFTAIDATETALTLVKTDIQKVNRDLVYMYPEFAKKNKKKLVMMQLLNPDFCSRVRVYDDPGAKETRGLAVQGMRVTGGIKKSYYVKYNGKLSHIKKGNYRKLFKEYFGDCPDLGTRYTSSWRDFPDHLYFYEQNCQTK